MTGKEFKELRTSVGLTQEIAAQKLHRSVDTIRSWERSKNLNNEVIDPLYDLGIKHVLRASRETV